MRKIKNFFHSKRSLYVLGILALFAVFLQFSPWLVSWLDRAIVFVGDIADSEPLLAALIFLLITAFSAVLSFFSSAPLVPMAVSIWGGINTVYLLLFGWILGGILAYTLAYYLGKPIVIKFVREEKFNYYTDRVLHKATFPLVVLFRLALPSEIGGLVLGLLRYPFWKYFLATALTELPFAFVLTYAGEAVLKHDFRKVIVYIAIIAILLTIFSFVLKACITKQKNNHVAISEKKDSCNS